MPFEGAPRFTPPQEKPKESSEASGRGIDLIRKLMSEEPVHGLGYERFTAAQRNDVESLFSIAGTTLTDPLDHLLGETAMDIRDYVSAKPGSPERANLKARIIEAIGVARDKIS